MPFFVRGGIMKTKKEALFDEFLQEEHLDCFEKHVVDDEDDTVVYRSYIQTEHGDIPVFLILDASIYNVLRFVVGAHVVDGTNKSDILNFINQENAKFKSFKYYIEEEDQTLYLDVVYMAGSQNFAPPLLYVLMRQVVEYLPTVEETLLHIFGTPQMSKECDAAVSHD